jgi:Fe-S cluster assembly ATP-binding protein
MKPIFQAKDLTIKAANKIVASNISLSLNKGEVEVILGPNAAGKSSLLKAIAGFSDFQISKGIITFNGEILNHLSPNKRAKKGIFLIHQSPPAIKGIKLQDFLNKISSKKIKLGPQEEVLTKRQLNVNFSGGEKKISELLQARKAQPKLLLIDEIDSGLDLVNLKRIAQVLKKEFINKGTAVLLITHRGEIMQYLNPKKAHVMLNGQFCCAENWQRIWQTIKKHGYQRCKECIQ